MEVRVSAGQGGVKLRVEDRGAGVAPDRVPELFEPFFTTKSDGTGLGLAISRAIARQHGGELTYSRARDVTCFELLVAGGRLRGGRARLLTEGRGRVTGRGSAPAPRVLIVEDEPGLREGLVGAVETLGYRALPAAGLAEARRLFAAEPRTASCSTSA